MNPQPGQHEQVKRFVWAPDFVDERWPFGGVNNDTDRVTQTARQNWLNPAPAIGFPKQIRRVSTEPSDHQEDSVADDLRNTIKEHRPQRDARDGDDPQHHQESPTARIGK